MQVKYLANLLAFVYNFFLLIITLVTSLRVMVGKNICFVFPFSVLCCSVLSFVFARGLAKVKCGGI